MTSEENPSTNPSPIEIRFTKWLKGFPDVPSFGATADPKNMATFRILGDQFTGKSSLLEAIVTNYLSNGSSAYDIFGANDNEDAGLVRQPIQEVGGAHPWR